MYSAKNSCTATFSHLFIGPSSPMESYSDGMKEEIQWQEGEGRKCVCVGGGFSQRKNYKDQIINILELRKKKRKKKKEKHLRTTFYYSFFWSPDPHRTHWIFIVESIKWTDLQFLTLMVPLKEGSGIFRIVNSLFLGFFCFFCGEMPVRYFGLPIHKICLLPYVFGGLS